MTTGTMHPDEALAVARLRQWCHDRLQLTSARTIDYQRTGWRQRKDTEFDSRLVRVIDFGRALANLDADEQAALIFAYRDRERWPQIAQALCCSIRRVSYLIPTARRKLAAHLDRLNLL
jgi:DNA-directed RNA polymerase specialized sigma24 family protein